MFELAAVKSLKAGPLSVSAALHVVLGALCLGFGAVGTAFGRAAARGAAMIRCSAVPEAGSPGEVLPDRNGAWSAPAKA